MPGTSCRTTAFLILCGALAGCAASDGELATDRFAGALSATQLRIVHASATSDPFDIYLGATATPAFTGVAFGAATAYIAVSTGSTEVALRPAGAAASDPPVFTSSITVNEGESVTAVAASLLGSTLDGVRFRVEGFVEHREPTRSGRGS